jgi:hypothetical protein
MTAHLAGIHVTVDGRYVRQRCAWCGEIIVDADATLIAKPVADIREGETAAEFVGVWPVSRFVRVDGRNPRVTELLDEAEGYPDDACMAIDPAVTL